MFELIVSLSTSLKVILFFIYCVKSVSVALCTGMWATHCSFIWIRSSGRPSTNEMAWAWIGVSIESKNLLNRDELRYERRFIHLGNTGQANLNQFYRPQ